MRSFLMSPQAARESLQPRGAVPRTPLTEIVKETATDLVTLVTAEVKLARLELVAGLRHAAGRALWVAVGLIPLLTAYLLAVAALALWLRHVWGWAGSLAATAVTQAIIGGAILWTLPCSTPGSLPPDGLAPGEPKPSDGGNTSVRRG